MHPSYNFIDYTNNQQISCQQTINVNNNLLEGEYVEIKPRKNRIVVERWLEYVIDGKTVRTEKMSNDTYAAFNGEYAVGPGTETDSKTGKPKGRKVSEEYLTKKRETTKESTTAKKETEEETTEGTTKDSVSEQEPEDDE